jgi:hypothetical protein
MKTSLLLPHAFRMYGWMIFIPFLVLGLAYLYYDFNFPFLEFRLPAYTSHFFATEGNQKGNLTDEIAALGLIISLMMIGFSKEKIEDEQISRLRLDSLQWSVYVNYLVLALAIVFIHGMDFLFAMVYNMFTLLVFFIIRFQWAIYRENKLLNA